VLPENSGVAQAVDVLSHNSFPYFEEMRQNSIDTASDNFWSAVAATESVAQGKPVWITETGWPDCEFLFYFTFITAL
jgi:glucan endo-1,3-beta-D-glucosidase